MTQGSDRGHPPFGGHVLRALTASAVVAALLVGGGAPRRGTEDAAAAVTAVRAAAPSPASYELVSRTASKRPLRWLACRPIDVRVNRSGMPKGMDTVVARSLDVIRGQTGVRFRMAGSTKRAFTTTTRPRTPTIYISFTAKSRAYGQTFAYPGEIGIGGPTGAWYDDGDGRRFEAITSGRVLLSTTFRGPRLGTGSTWQSLIVHEVGHALNLAHRSPAKDAMHPTLTKASPGRFQPQEVAALRRVLQRTGCDYAAWSRL